MREILFRGKVKSGVMLEQWVEGYLFIMGNEYYIFEPSIEENLFYQYEIIPETIGQYTGLKDKNSVKIFEGDILRDYGNEIEDWIVSYEYGKFVGTFDNVCEDLYEISDLEVIGNIHDKEV